MDSVTSVQWLMAGLCLVFGAIVYHWRPHYTKRGYVYILILTAAVLGSVWTHTWLALLALGILDFIVFMGPWNERVYWHHSETEDMVHYMIGKWLSGLAAFVTAQLLCLT